MNKLAFLASTAIALVCAVSLVATPADAKKRHHRKPAAAPTAQMAGGAGMGGPMHSGGSPVKTGTMCWKEIDASHDRGYWANCPK